MDLVALEYTIYMYWVPQTLVHTGSVLTVVCSPPEAGKPSSPAVLHGHHQIFPY